MAEYNINDIEKKWQDYWKKNQVYKVTTDPSRPKFYVLDMFPYPSGAGLHVGHPLGYIASDIVARFKRLKGFNVLHPMGFDAFGLPAEQYAIDTGQHPAITTAQNIEKYKEQLNNLGFSYDWDREVQTCDPSYYKWTQWIFMQLFNSWYDKKTGKALAIESLIEILNQQGNAGLSAACDDDTPEISAEEWKAFSDEEKAAFLLKYRLTYPADSMVNWCPALGTVLANDEVKDGFSERGGHPVERKKMKQWMMRITAYADRLLENLEKLNWSEALKEMQRNWIGKSYGCELDFKVVGKDITLTAFTTRSDTIYGVTYVVLAPEHELIETLTTPDQKEAVDAYVSAAKNRSERERMADVKTVSGVFTGSFVVNPFNNEEVPLWIADYVLAGYGTGVVMAVPSSDDRDFRFARHFDLPVRCVIEGTEEMADPTEKKHGKMINSGILNGMESTDAITAANNYAAEKGIGKPKVNYRMRDAVFSRQRYWGEPVPVHFKNGIPHLIDEKDLPLELPPVDEYKPTETGEPPLARAKDWKYKGDFDYEHTTMPGWAGSSWYFLRYMDATNDREFVSSDAVKYWNEVDLYIGGTEHATGHLLYSRFWNMFLYDRGFIFHEEPFRRLVNQGMIQGRSNMVYKLKDQNKFVSEGLKDDYEVIELRADVNMVDHDILDIEAFKKWRPEYSDAEFVLEGGKYKCGVVVEKMSKSKYNTINPDDMVSKYGADTLRMYEMFLGPIEMSKPWNTAGIDGVAKFLRRFWMLFFDDKGKYRVNDENPAAEELKVLHKTIKKVQDDIEQLSFNTCVSEFMICLNQLTQLKCYKKAILQELVVVLSPFAPHLCEELWHHLGNADSVVNAAYPVFNPQYVQEASFEYPIMINGKLRAKISFAVDAPQDAMKETVLGNEIVQKWLDGKAPKNIIVVPNKIINVVV
ncbi:MAG: leucine--tRNA ligase [Cyclobacteriaceae bacterium]|nr:leucine--tRNA ligase [Cyclobacteriaceae bacterium]